MDEQLQLRVYGEASLPTLIYLPGLHGDWTLIGRFREAVAGKVRFVEMTYPRTLVWSLDEYAAAIEAALAGNGIASGWLLGESFGSQPMWSLVQRGRFEAQGVILAGGFVRLPMQWLVRWAEKIAGRAALSLLTQIIFPVTNRAFAWFYVTLARFRFRHSPGTLDRMKEFMDRRTPLDFLAARHRLHLVGESDPGAAARSVGVPVFALAGWLDPIVLWFAVRRWLRRNCPMLRDFKVLRGDHAILMTAPREAAQQILRWMAGGKTVPAG